MITWLKNFIFGTAPERTEAKLSGEYPVDPPKRFTRQSAMIARAPELGKGICVQLANAYVEAHIKGEDPTLLLKDEALFLKRALEQTAYQESMKKNGVGDLHYPAFERHRIPYERIEVEASDMKSASGIQKAAGDSKYTLFSVPVSKKAKHMVALINEGKNRCTYFDADMPGGRIKSSCPKIWNIIARTNSSILMKNIEIPAKVGRSL